MVLGRLLINEKRLISKSIPYQVYISLTLRNRIWLIDLAKEMPNANLHGFDVSTAQFPHKNWLPAHVSLQQLDAFGDIPPVLIEKYDVVHIGLIVAAIRGGDPSPLVDKLLSVLSMPITPLQGA